MHMIRNQEIWSPSVTGTPWWLFSRRPDARADSLVGALDGSGVDHDTTEVDGAAIP